MATVENFEFISNSLIANLFKPAGNKIEYDFTRI
jgi:hypothetical protein